MNKQKHEKDSEVESCFWCVYVKVDSTKSTNITGWCSKRHKTVDLEQEGCEDFSVRETFRRMMKKEKAST